MSRLPRRGAKRRARERFLDLRHLLDYAGLIERLEGSSSGARTGSAEVDAGVHAA